MLPNLSGNYFSVALFGKTVSLVVAIVGTTDSSSALGFSTASLTISDHYFSCVIVALAPYGYVFF